MKIKEPKGRRLMLLTAGILLIAVGVVLFKLSLMGNDPSTAMVIAVGANIGVDYGLVLVAMHCLCFVAQALWGREMIGAGTFFNWFLIGPMASSLERWLRLRWTVPDAFLPRLSIMLLGVLVLSFAAALYQTADLGIAPYDSLSIMLSKKSKRSYFWCRMLTDAFCVTVAFLLGGVIGLGSLICALGLGPFIALFSRCAAEPILQSKKNRAALQ